MKMRYEKCVPRKYRASRLKWEALVALLKDDQWLRLTKQELAKILGTTKHLHIVGNCRCYNRFAPRNMKFVMKVRTLPDKGVIFFFQKLPTL